MGTETDETTDLDETVQITLDGETRRVERNRPLIEVAREHGSYVPGWCHHPGMRPASELDAADTVYRSQDAPTPLPAQGVSGIADDDAVGPAGTEIPGDPADLDGCDMCMVEVDGELVRACETRAAAGQEVQTATDEAREHQEQAMRELFEHHPHACLNCPQKEGCDRISCSMGVPEEKRCCDLIGNCELEKSAEAIHLDWGKVPSYEPLDRSAQTTAIFDINWELCIGCKRCVGVCEDHVGAGVWKFTAEDESAQGDHTEATVGMKAEMLAKAGCKFCTTCVEACPTGALMDNEGADNEKLPLEYRESLPKAQFPESKLPMDADTITAEVPDEGGVYMLYDEDGDVFEINGVADLRAELVDEVDRSDAVEFEFELDESFTQRETELIEGFVSEHGHMPGAGGDMDDLF